MTGALRMYLWTPHLSSRGGDPDTPPQIHLRRVLVPLRSYLTGCVQLRHIYMTL